MADNLLIPWSGRRVTNSSGVIQAGALVYIYDEDTTNLKTIYSDRDLGVTQANPVTCDAGGLIPQIYIGASAYKIKITSSGGTSIDEQDDLPGALDTSTFSATYAKVDEDFASKTADYSMVAGDVGTALNCNSTGGDITVTLLSAVTVGNGRQITARHTGTANTVTIATSSSQTIDGVLTLVLRHRYDSVTLRSDGANWHKVSASNALLPALTLQVVPQGRLTLTSGTPVTTTDVTAATAVYYRAFTGATVPIYSSTYGVFLAQTITSNELSLTLVASHSANTLYDGFAFMDPTDGTTTRIGTGPAWSASTAGTSSRGSGAGTTELSLVGGIWVNAASMTMRNGNSTYSVAAFSGTYLGTFRTTSAAGQTEDSIANRLLWNAYNESPRALRVVESTNTWTYTTLTWRQANASATNQFNIVIGLLKHPTKVTVHGLCGNSSSVNVATGVGIDSTSVNSAQVFGASAFDVTPIPAYYVGYPSLGFHNIAWLEISVATGTSTWRGDDGTTVLQAGMIGEIMA